MSRIADKLDRRFPRFAFARHVPLRQIAVRLMRRAAAKAGLGKPRPLTDWALRWEKLPDLPVPPGPVGAEHEEGSWRFTFLGRTIVMAGAIDWDAPSLGSADQLWRMNLHYMEYLSSLSGADGLAAIMEWIARNAADAPGASHAPWNAYALSIRVAEWLRFLARPEVSPSRQQVSAIEASLASQLGFLMARPETDIGGNHLVRNVRALLWAAACSYGRGSERLKNVGTALLERVLSVQILTDGTHFELSPSYHCQVLGDLIDCRSALGSGTHSGLDGAVERMLAAARVLSHRDGRIAQFGDSGLHMASPVGALEAALGHSAGVLCHGVLPRGGFAAATFGPLSIVMRFGSIAADTLPAHAHADAGSIEVAGPTGRIIVDQGVFAYIAGESRRRSRDARSHNLTLAGDGMMADFFGDFRLGRRPTVTGVAELTPQALTAECHHDGFRDAAGPLMMTRRVRAGPDGISLADSVDRSSPTPIRSHYLLHPDCDAVIGPDGPALSGGGLEVRLTGTGSWSIEPAVWWPDMGIERPTQRLVCRWADRQTSNTFTLTAAAARAKDWQ